MLVTVVIPAYNRQVFLKEAVESVIRQQAWLIQQQQNSIARLVSSTTGKNSVDWKYIVLCLGLAVFFLLLQNNSSRRNPRIERVSGYIDDLAGFVY